MIEWTPAQVVAYNVRRLRQDRRWSQAEAAERCGPYMPRGEPWSPQVWSMMEQSVKGQRVRAFTADELVGLALGFGAPLAALFLPPYPDAQGPNRIRAAEADDGIPTLDLLKLAFEIDKSTLDRIDELSRPITDQSDGPDWREYDGSTVEQRREAFVYREVRRAVEHLYDLVQRPTWYEE